MLGVSLIAGAKSSAFCCPKEMKEEALLGKAAE